jgi:hypothetical protein
MVLLFSWTLRGTIKEFEPASGKTHSIKVKCDQHANCSFFKSSKALPYSAVERIAEWLMAGTQFPDKGQTQQHKALRQP